MPTTQSDLKSLFSFKKVIIPILIGIGFSVFSLVSNNFNFSVLKGIEFSIYYILLAILLMMVRDCAYMWRLRILTERHIKWKDSFQIIMLWEFASAVTPSMVGGSAFAIFFIKEEGIPLGRSTAIVMVTALLDELFYILMVPIAFLFTGVSIFSIGSSMSFNPILLFFIGYGFIVLLTTIITLGIFVSPATFKKILSSVFSLSFLKRWKPQAERTGDEIIITSKELKGKPFIYWFKAFFATCLSWTARFWVLNCLILALNPSMAFDFGQQMAIYAKQLIMWVILLISPTPGGSGIAEFSFSAFFGSEFPANIKDSVALLWRAISYYPYLFIGLIVLPVWLGKLQKRNKKKQNNEDKVEREHK